MTSCFFDLNLLDRTLVVVARQDRLGQTRPHAARMMEKSVREYRDERWIQSKTNEHENSDERISNTGQILRELSMKNILSRFEFSLQLDRDHNLLLQRRGHGIEEHIDFLNEKTNEKQTVVNFEITPSDGSERTPLVQA